MSVRKCEDCGWTVQAVWLNPEGFRSRLPVLHCINCDCLEVMSDSNHTPPADAFRMPEGS